jgi:hypothetical protein
LIKKTKTSHQWAIVKQPCWDALELVVLKQLAKLVTAGQLSNKPAGIDWSWFDKKH